MASWPYKHPRRSAHDAVHDIRASALRGISRAARNHNALSFIESVPAEIISLTIGQLPLRERIIASHVCHRWRTISLGTASLWCQINLTRDPLDMIDAFFERSKAASLYVHYLQRNGSDALRGELLKGHEAHVQTIDWTGSLDHLSPMLQQRTDRLAKLRVHGPPYARSSTPILHWSSSIERPSLHSVNLASLYLPQ